MTLLIVYSLLVNNFEFFRLIEFLLTMTCQKIRSWKLPGEVCLESSNGSQRKRSTTEYFGIWIHIPDKKNVLQCWS